MTSAAKNLKDQGIKNDLECPMSVKESDETTKSDDILDIDRPCLELSVDSVPQDNVVFTESDKHNVDLQTTCQTATATDNPYSFGQGDAAAARLPPPVVTPISTYADQPYVPCIKIEPKDDVFSRNPITGLGLNGDGVGGLKPMRMKNREGNPVTGEGYKPGATDYIQPAAALNGGNQVINKNRVPPGGYSSGLW